MNSRCILTDPRTKPILQLTNLHNQRTSYGLILRLNMTNLLIRQYCIIPEPARTQDDEQSAIITHKGSEGFVVPGAATQGGQRPHVMQCMQRTIEVGGSSAHAGGIESQKTRDRCESSRSRK